MKKVMFVCAICMVFVLALSPLCTFASGLDEWTNLPGFKVGGKIVPAELKMTDKGLQVTCPGGHYDDDGNYQGVILNTPVDVKHFTVEFTVDKVAGFASNTDTWIGVHLFDKKAYFSVGNPEQSKGLVTLMRPYETGSIFQSFQHVNGFGWQADTPVEQEPVGSYKMEFITNGDGTFKYIINGKEADAEYDALAGIFKDNKAYFSMGASTSNGETTIFTINKINGKAVKASDVVKEEPKKEDVKKEETKNEAVAETKAKTTSNPKTADASAIPFAVAAVTAGAATLGLVRRKK